MSDAEKTDRTEKRVFVKTFGCQMNEYDSFRIIKMLESHGYTRAESYKDADCILLNTCTVRQKAEDKVYSELGRIKKIKRSKPDLIIGVGGCLGQQEGRNLIKKYPYIDLVFGTQSMSRLPDMLAEAAENSATDTRIDYNDSIYPHADYTVAPGQTGSFISIMQGCDNYCAYCIVPYVRGRERSRTPEDILTEIRSLVRSGVKEITLLGQNVNSYGKGLEPGVSFPDLLAAINAVRGLERVRFVTSHPKDLSDDLIACFGDLDKVCEHIHLPLQSGSNEILQKMNRKYSRRDYLKKIDSLRLVKPGISITSDIIVGFPGETEQDFQDTVDIINDIRFTDLFIFHYTDRKGTKAATHPEKIPYDVKIKRLKILNDIQRDISHDINKQHIGRIEHVLFDGVSKKASSLLAGRTRTNIVVNCKGGSADLLGQIHPVKITRANIHSLSGELVVD